MSDLLAVPESRRAGLERVLDRLLAAPRVVLTTHVNADGDGCGTEGALAAWLEGRGARVTIVNPTPFPDAFRFVLHRPDLVADAGTPEADGALATADLVLVVDTAEAPRLGELAPKLDPARTVVVDHHPAHGPAVGALAVQDPTAAAAGELACDLVALSGEPMPAHAALAAYVAIVSDTGSFRYGNTTPRVHALAAELMSAGIDPEEVFRRLFATAPRRRLELLRDALGTLELDPAGRVAWMVVTGELTARHGATGEDFDGLIDHARSIEGVEVALLFREVEGGETKVSLRSSGQVDVNRIARGFGGGGHVKASGATIPGSAERVAPKVVEAVVEAVQGSA